MTLKETLNKRFQSAARNEELGYTDKYEGRNKRVLNKDGEFNVIRIGVKTGIFHHMLTIGWWRFALSILGFYSMINLLFATLYLLIDFNGIGFTSDYEIHNRFFIALFFSAQTLTTVGYGSLYPLSAAVSFLASTEALVGLMGFAIFTGVMYGRFSRPVSGLKFSSNALIAPYKGGKSFQFRVANGMSNNLMNLEARALLSIVVTEGDRQIRRFQPLSLDNSKISYLSINWTCVHPIDEKSPLWGMTEEDFINGNIEILVMVQAYNETFGQDVHARSSYTWAEIEWDKRFRIPYHFNEDGVTVFDINRLEETEVATI